VAVVASSVFGTRCRFSGRRRHVADESPRSATCCNGLPFAVPMDLQPGPIARRCVAKHLDRVANRRRCRLGANPVGDGLLVRRNQWVASSCSLCPRVPGRGKRQAVAG
jgi:hypothetical protein